MDPLKSIHHASWVLMMHHGYSWCIMSTRDASRLLMMHHEYSWCIISTHDASWALMLHHEYLWRIMSSYDASCRRTQGASQDHRGSPGTSWWYSVMKRIFRFPVTKFGAINVQSMPGHFPTIPLYQKLPIYRPSGRHVIRNPINLYFSVFLAFVISHRRESLWVLRMLWEPSAQQGMDAMFVKEIPTRTDTDQQSQKRARNRTKT